MCSWGNMGLKRQTFGKAAPSGVQLFPRMWVTMEISWQYKPCDLSAVWPWVSHSTSLRLSPAFVKSHPGETRWVGHGSQELRGAKWESGAAGASWEEGIVWPSESGNLLSHWSAPGQGLTLFLTLCGLRPTRCGLRYLGRWMAGAGLSPGAVDSGQLAFEPLSLELPRLPARSRCEVAVWPWFLAQDPSNWW